MSGKGRGEREGGGGRMEKQRREKKKGGGGGGEGEGWGGEVDKSFSTIFLQANLLESSRFLVLFFQMVAYFSISR